MYSNYDVRTEESEKMKQEFKNVLSQYGKQIADTPERMTAIILDEYPDLKPETKTLKDALAYQTVHDSIIGGHFKKKEQEETFDYLTGTKGWTPTQAENAVGWIAYALGVKVQIASAQPKPVQNQNGTPSGQNIPQQTGPTPMNSNNIGAPPAVDKLKFNIKGLQNKFSAKKRNVPIIRIVFVVAAIVIDVALVIFGFSSGTFKQALDTGIGTYLIFQGILIANALIGLVFSFIAKHHAPCYIMCIVSIGCTLYSFVAYLVDVFSGNNGGVHGLELIFTVLVGILFFGGVAAGITKLCTLFMGWAKRR